MQAIAPAVSVAGFFGTLMGVLIALPAAAQAQEAMVQEPRALEAPPVPPDPQRLVYGVGIVSEVPASAGALCRDDATCIMSGGGGILVRVALATRGGLDAGFAYSLTKQGSARLYRLATLQQLRFEGRYTFSTGRTIEPFLSGGVGVAGYGNEWGLDTWAPTLSAGPGVMLELDKDAFVSVGLDYRAMRFAEFSDQTGRVRAPTLVHMIGLRLSIEARGKL